LAGGDKIHIIGIGEDGLDGLTLSAQQLIRDAEILIGDEITLAVVPSHGGERLEVGSDLDEVVQRIAAAAGKRIVLLAVGDPLFYGVARYLCDRLGKDRFEVVPHVSSMQLAFARVKESWDEAYLANLASHSLDHVVEKIRTSAKAGLFTTEEVPPSVVARALLERHLDYFTAYICENLGSPDERVTRCELAEVTDHEFSPLNVLILIRKPDVPDRPLEMLGRRLFGNPDEAFLQSRPKRGLLTRQEVRTIALAQMDLGATSIVWDVCAGSGAVAIEAARVASQGTTYAIEMDPEDHGLIVQNAERFGVHNLVPVLGKAPEAWADLPDPDSVFVGGAGRTVTSLCEAAFERLKAGGRLVVNLESIENLATVHRLLHKLAGDAPVWMFNIAHGTFQLERIKFESMNPTFLVAAIKPA
jgi:precorrin-6Y C5,15-methyltransferase (decarboxylating)